MPIASITILTVALVTAGAEAIFKPENTGEIVLNQHMITILPSGGEFNDLVLPEPGELPQLFDI